MNIREVKGYDIELLAKMNFQLIEDEGHRNLMSILELTQRMDEWLNSQYKAVIIEDENVPIGYSLWRKEESYLYIRQFFIVASNRRKGFGLKAIENLKQELWAGQHLRLEVLINNVAAQSFWQAVGFNNYCLTMEYEST